MRHWAIAAGVAIGAMLGVGLGLVAWPIRPDHVRRDLSAALGTVETPVEARLTLLPRPRLRISGLKGVAADGALSFDALAADVPLRFDRLLAGKFAPLGATLTGAKLRVDFDAAKDALKGFAEPPLSRLILRGGEIEVFSPQAGWTTRFEVGSARLDWSAPEGPLRATATGRWRSQPIDATIELDSPLAALRGATSALRASLDAPLSQLRFSGDLTPQGEVDGSVYSGQASALIPSIARFAHWIGRPPLNFAPAGVEMEARANGDLRQIKLADLTLSLAGQSFEGGLDVARTAAGVSVSGSLAAESVDVDPLIGAPPRLFDANGAWSTLPALPAPDPALDLDLRLSAARATWGGHALENTAAAVSQGHGRIAVKLLEAGLAHGALSGEMSVEDVKGVCESRLALSLESADLGALLADFGQQSFAGQGAIHASLRARGRSPAEIAATADGDGALEIVDGALRNLNFEEALRRGQRKFIDVAHDMSAGATRFGAAHGRFEISNGEARFLDAATQSAGVSLSVTGAIDLIGRAWRARVAARQSSDDGQPTPDGARLDFALYGPWAGPVLTPITPPTIDGAAN